MYYMRDAPLCQALVSDALDASNPPLPERTGFGRVLRLRAMRVNRIGMAAPYPPRWSHCLAD